MTRKEIINAQAEDNALCPNLSQFTLSEWRTLLKLVDAHTVRVDHDDEYEEWQELQRKLLLNVSAPDLFSEKE